MKEFWRRTEELEDDCLLFLDTKFTRRRSALSAFQMLKDFTTTASRPRINMKLGEKFVDILRHFSMHCPPMRVLFQPKYHRWLSRVARIQRENFTSAAGCLPDAEVDRMRNLFDRGHEKPLIPNHMPPVSGAILWSSGLLQALKASVLAFKQMPEVFDFDQAEHVFGNYLSFAKSITAYQNSLVKQWQVC